MQTKTKIDRRERVTPVYLGGLKIGDFFSKSKALLLIPFDFKDGMEGDKENQFSFVKKF
jgi:hypothetical protein